MARSLALVAATALLACVGNPSVALAEDSAWESTEALLIEGKLAEAQKSLKSTLESDAKNDEARFALGVVHTLSGVEQLMQGLYRHGLQPTWATSLPFVRLPVPDNPNPEPLTNEAFRALIADFAADLADIERTLAQVDSDGVKILVRPGMYRLDFDADGKATADESLWRIFFRLTGATVRDEDAGQFVIAMDKADAHWLRGYAHFLAALCEMYLAHDTQHLHDRAAQFFFPSAKVRYPFDPPDQAAEWTDDLLDGIAFIHLLNLPVAEPRRLKTAHGHLLAMVEQSRASFAAIRAETDDNREWIPSPKQQNLAFPQGRITAEMVDGWHAVLEEWEAILQGKKLVPFWRGGDRGVNVRRVFHEPTTFDLVLWVQGSAAAPYLEDGEQTSPDFWRDVQQGFQGQFFWFAIWVN
jgi:hypothetical protein